MIRIHLSNVGAVALVVSYAPVALRCVVLFVGQLK